MPIPSSGRIVLPATAALVTAIWLAGLSVASHTSLDPPRWVLVPTDAASWTRVGDPAAATFERGVTLRSSVAGTNRLYLDLPLERRGGDTARLQLSGRLIEERRVGRSWATASLGLSFKTISGRRLDYTELAILPRHATRGERFETVLDWPADAVSAEISLNSRAGAPTFSLVEGSAEAVRPNPLHRLSLGALAAAALLWAWIVVRFVRARGALAAVAVPAAIAIAIVVGVTLSMQVLRPSLMPLLVAIESLHAIDRERAAVLLLKGGHALGFFLLTLGLLRLRHPLRVGATPLLAIAALLAVGSEGLQSHLVGRGASLTDVLVDLAGVSVAFVLVRSIGGKDRRSTGRRPGERRTRTRRRRRRSTSRDGSAAASATGTATAEPVHPSTDDRAADDRAIERPFPRGPAPEISATDASTARADGRRGRRRRRRHRNPAA